MLNKRLLKESKFKRFYMIAAILTSLFNSLFIIISAYFLAAIVSGVFLKAKSLEEIKNYLILFILNAFFKTIINFISEIYIKNSAEGIKENFRKKLFELILC
jgi:ATP-binding cassette subfamily C protein CydD